MGAAQRRFRAQCSSQTCGQVQGQAKSEWSDERMVADRGKLQQIRIEEFHLPQAVEVSEVLKNLHTLSRKLDPEKRGVIIVPSSIVVDRRLIPVFDIGMGIMRVALEDYTVKISPPLRNISLRELLDAIVEAAVPPKGHESAPRLRYSIEEYGVVFRQRTKYAVELIDAPLKAIAAE